MKKMTALILAMVSANVLANADLEKQIELSSTTHRVKSIGYDCGEFFQGTVEAPSVISSKNIELTRLDADKDLNIFLVKATFSAENETCYYGVFLDRSRETKTLDFNHSVLLSTNGTPSEKCVANQNYLDELFKSSSYYVSKRGIRYIAVDVIQGENEVCSESQNVRAVFDRRLE